MTLSKAGKPVVYATASTAMLYIVAVLLLTLSASLAAASDDSRPRCKENTTCSEDLKPSDYFSYKIKGNRIYIKYQSGLYIFLLCASDMTSVDDPELPVFSQRKEVEVVELHNCTAPLNTSFYHALEAINIAVTKKLLLKDIKNPKLEKYHFNSLKINELEIENTNHRPSHDYLDGIEGLRSLKLKDVTPESNSFLRLPSSIESLTLEYVQLPTVLRELNDNYTWLYQLHSLRSLNLRKQGGAETWSMPRFELLRNLKNLDLHNMPLNSTTVLPSQLVTLDVSDNYLNNTAFVNILSSVPQLQILKANNNPFGSLCNNTTPVRWPKPLRQLELKNTNATQICPEWIENDDLMEIDLSNNDIKYLRYNELKMRRVELNATVYLDLSNNPNLSIMNVTDDDVSQCLNDSLKDANNRTRVRVTVTVHCDHGAYLLQKRLRNCSKVTVKINDDSFASDDSLCKYSDPCLEGCSCNRRPSDNAIVVNNCAKGLPPAPWPPEVLTSSLVLIVGNGTLNQMPKVQFVELHAANNNISTIDLDDIKDNLIRGRRIFGWMKMFSSFSKKKSLLKNLDLRNNRIRHISVEVAQKLNDIGTVRNISLKGNKLNCTCADVPTFKLLENIVTDWSDIQCTDDVHVWIKMKSGLCTSVLPIVLPLSFIALLVLTVLLCVLKCQPNIRKVLFKLNFCKRYVFRINEFDPTKDKDVFISYCYEDREKMIVIKNYLESKGYSTLEHTRDWQPGEFVLDQIDESVSRSRRTLVILTDNFMSSSWMAPEFRSAHAHAMERRTSKVVVVKFDLSRPELLPSDLQVYLRWNTYLYHQNPNFWEKLILAMPTRISMNAINR